MNINEPEVSRTLAALIQGVQFEDRDSFIEDAKEALNMEAFMKGMTKYKRVGGVS